MDLLLCELERGSAVLASPLAAVSSVNVGGGPALCVAVDEADEAPGPMDSSWGLCRPGSPSLTGTVAPSFPLGLEMLWLVFTPIPTNPGWVLIPVDSVLGQLCCCLL